MRLVIAFLLLTSITGYCQPVLVAKPGSRNVSYFKPAIIPGGEYEIVKADSVADKFWLKRKAGDNLTTSTDYSQDNSIKGADIQQYFWSQKACDSIIRRHGKVAWKKLIDGKLVIGWSPDLCKLSWGDPMRIKQSHNLDGTVEQWIYANSSQLFFKNGKLNTIED
jgi:hypothetical protein